METITNTPEEHAQAVLDDYNRARAALLTLRSRLEQLEHLPRRERWTVSEQLDPVGKLLVYRTHGDTSRPLVYEDAEELLGHAQVIRGKLGFLLERISVLGDTVLSPDAPEPLPETTREDVPAWEKKSNDLMGYGIGWTPGPNSHEHGL